MKMLFFCNLRPNKLGAFERFAIALSSRLHERGHDVIWVFSGCPCEAVAESLQKASARWHVVAEWQDRDNHARPWRILPAYLRIVRRERPEVCAVHFGNELPLVGAIVLTRLMGARCRWVWHQRQQIADPGCLGALFSRIRMVSWFCNRLVTLYDGGAESLRKRGIPDRQIVRIYNGVGGPRTEVGGRGTEDGVRVCSVTSLIERKRPDVLIRAFAEAVSGVQPPPVLHIAGDGPLMQDMQRLAAALGIEAQVVFAGRRDDIPAWLASMDIFMLTSVAEACPLAVLESMAAGLPAVVTDAGANAELVVEGQTGFVVETNTEAALAERLRRLLHNQALRVSMGRQARTRWLNGFSLDLMVDAHVVLYEQGTMLVPHPESIAERSF